MSILDKDKVFGVKDGVVLIQEPQTVLSQAYLTLRTKEQRILSNEQVTQLPQFKGNKQQQKEWKCRQDTLVRFQSHLEKHPNKVILEIGCGNGWFSNAMQPFAKEVIGQDINLEELEQAAQVFPQEALTFVYAHDLVTWLPTLSVDMIVFNASFQYFEHVADIIHLCQKALNPAGEIHILDTPIYANTQEALNAKNRSNAYYDTMQASDMKHNYFHHVATDFTDFDWMYKPITNKLLKKLQKQQSPFPWLRGRED